MHDSAAASVSAANMDAMGMAGHGMSTFDASVANRTAGGESARAGTQPRATAAAKAMSVL
jgi:hypothetical protein